MATTASTKPLTSYRALCFDIYGTIIDWETGIVSNLEASLPANHSFTRAELLKLHHKHEAAYQASHPSLPYSDLLSAIHPLILADLDVRDNDTSHSSNANSSPTPTEEAAAIRFGDLRTWPAFADSVTALQRLRQHYKLVVLSNVDRQSFTTRTLNGPLRGVQFDLVITAEDVGSYKPARRNFEYMLHQVKEKLGLENPLDEVLVTAQSQWHDHQPARELGLGRCWIDRAGAVMGNVDVDVDVDGGEGDEMRGDREEGKAPLWQWRFGTLAEMVVAVEGEKIGKA